MIVVVRGKIKDGCIDLGYLNSAFDLFEFTIQIPKCFELYRSDKHYGAKSSSSSNDSSSKQAGT